MEVEEWRKKGKAEENSSRDCHGDVRWMKGADPIDNSACPQPLHHPVSYVQVLNARRNSTHCRQLRLTMFKVAVGPSHVNLMSFTC